MDRKFLATPNIRPGGESRRSDPRRSEFLLGGLVLTGDGRPPLSCVVHDKSPKGARLELERLAPGTAPSSADLPEAITLRILPTRTEVRCRISWRDGVHLGVAFMSDEQVIGGRRD